MSPLRRSSVTRRIDVPSSTGRGSQWSHRQLKSMLNTFGTDRGRPTEQSAVIAQRLPNAANKRRRKATPRFQHLDFPGRPRPGAETAAQRALFELGFPWILSSGINLFNGLRGLTAPKYLSRASLPPKRQRGALGSQEIPGDRFFAIRSPYTPFGFSARICRR
jgi:hypothetical protein